MIGIRGEVRMSLLQILFFFQAEDGIRDYKVTGVQTCALPILAREAGWMDWRASSAASASTSSASSPAAGSKDDRARPSRVSVPVLSNTRVSTAASASRPCRLRTSTPLRDSVRSEEHTSELQSPCNLVCRLLLEKKKT